LADCASPRSNHHLEVVHEPARATDERVGDVVRAKLACRFLEKLHPAIKALAFERKPEIRTAPPEAIRRRRALMEP
jgi:hypothetical protein